jgi:hypothetical protein
MRLNPSDQRHSCAPQQPRGPGIRRGQRQAGCIVPQNGQAAAFSGQFHADMLPVPSLPTSNDDDLTPEQHVCNEPVF